MSRKFTLLVFMAADNDLETFAKKNIHFMESIGSTDEFAIAVQIDRRGGPPNGTALRGLIAKNPAWDQYDPEMKSQLQDIGETNTGDPAVLRDFILWGVRTFPANSYGLIIWNHGSGWKPEFIYEATEKSAGEGVSTAMKSVDFATHYKKKTRRLVFRSTLDNRIDTFIKTSLLPQLSPHAASSLLGFHGAIETVEAQRKAQMALLEHVAATDQDGFEQILLRAIGLDETSSGDALDALELQNAIRDAKDQLSSPAHEFSFAFVGFDACLMSGLEVAFQLKGSTGLMVASEEIEPAIGWPYHKLIGSVTAMIEAIDLPHLGQELVRNYIEALASYQIRLVTQSAISLTEAPRLISAMNDLAGELVNVISTAYAKLAQAEKTSTRFYDTDFLDIGHYLDKLDGFFDGDPRIGPKISAAKQAYQRVVLSSKFDFARGNQAPTGLSIYYPTRPIFDTTYEALPLIVAMPNWLRFIKQYHFLT